MVRQISKGAPELKAGHPPAVMAAGKRVAKKNLEEGAAHGTTEKETKKAADRGRLLVPSNRMQPVEVLLLGVFGKRKYDFPETPVSVRHSKLRPALEKTYRPSRVLIQQPKKF
ncbi:death-associated protein-like 1 homolog [Nelusetta ayraudi]|uniref:death-associated protein-like 1 homolog n=1 Tax=Nelusetta ayraudi TaxID=303726 RepID=UPI003F70E19E